MDHRSFTAVALQESCQLFRLLCQLVSIPGLNWPIGPKAATGEIVAFTDDDRYVPPDSSIANLAVLRMRIGYCGWQN